MNFLYPLAFIGFISLGIILTFYMLRQKQTIEPFSTTMLWEKAVLRTMASKPWQKLRKNLLMLLQLLAAALLTLALAHPFITGGLGAGHYVLVVDTSYHMQAVYEGATRFEEALRLAEEFIYSTPSGSVFSVVSAGKTPYISASAVDNKQQAAEAVKSLSVTSGRVDESILSGLVNSMAHEDVRFVFFSGKGFGFSGLNATDYVIGGESENLALTGISHSVDSDRVVVMVKVKNYGDTTAENGISLYADGVLHDIEFFRLEAGGETDVFFTNVPYGAVELSAELIDEDALAADNYRYDVVRYSARRQAVLFTEGNVFLENALRLVPSLELFKAEAGDINETSGYYLYIYDGLLPDILPEDGHVLVFNPPEGHPAIESEGPLYVEDFIINDRSFLSNIDNFEFDIAQSGSLVLPEGAEIMLSAHGSPIAFYQDTAAAKMAVFGFDLHETDLPLKKEFPIFIYNIVYWLAPEEVYQGESISSGELVSVNVYPDASRVIVTTPDNRAFTILPPDPAESFDHTERPGIYTVEQRLTGQTVYDQFSVNVKIDDNSNLMDGYRFSSGAGEGQGGLSGRRNLTNIALAVTIVLIIIEWYVLNKGVVKRPDAVRLGLTLLLIASLFNLNLTRATKDTAVIFAVDISDSAAEEVGDMQQLINDKLKDKKPKDTAGLLTFAREASIEHLPVPDRESFFITGGGDGRFTNISKALMSASGAFSGSYNKKIVLVSDGNENLGDAYLTAKQLRTQGIMIDVLPMETGRYADAQLTGIHVPSRIGKDMRYNIEVATYSVGENSGLLNIYKNNALILSSDVAMKNGENRFVFSDTADIGGHIAYRAEILPDKDYIYQNNKAYAYSYVDHVPKVLVANDLGSADEIAKILAQASLEYEILAPAFLPADIESINAYDAVILANINYEDLPEGFGDVLETYVKNGGGLLVTGGENAYALGGYYNTPLETVLPVNMELKSKEELPDQAMVIVLDRSGSMSSGRYGISKLSMAKESVIRSIDALNDEDYFGVLVFDTENQWVVDIQQVGGNRNDIIDKVAAISEGGGTLIKPAVVEGYNALAKMDTKLKHMILLTDGQDGDHDYAAIIELMKADGITMSTVAVGSDSDTDLLKGLAEQAVGRYYFTDEFTDLPKIFTKEAFLSGKKHLNNEEFYAVLGTYSPIMENIGALPPFYGFVSTTSKPRADVVLYAQQEEPLLAAWQYGIGRSVAFTSDMDGNWSRDMLLTDEGVSLFNNMLSWIVRKNIGMDIYTKAERVAEGMEITLTLPYTTGVRGVNALVTTPGFEEVDISFAQYAPGEYKAVMDSYDEGTYIASIALLKDGETEYTYSGINLSYSSEYDLRQVAFGGNLLSRIAAAGGGNVLDAESDFFEFLLDRNIVKIDIKPWVILLALFYLVFDIAYHRFPSVKAKLNIMNYVSALKKDRKNVELVLDGEKPEKPVEVSVRKEEIEHKNDVPEPPAEMPSMSQRLVSGKKKRSGR